MAIVKVNLFMPGQNLTNLANNVGWNYLGLDQTNILVNFGTSPATVTIKQGSWIEANGNRYNIDSDYVFQMSGASDNYITFTDDPTPVFSSTTVKGNYSDSKIGVYQADNKTRTIKWYINQSEEIYDINDSLLQNNIGNLKTEVNSHFFNGADNGIELYNATGLSGTHYSDSFEIYKPSNIIVYCNALLQQSYPSAGNNTQMPRAQMYLDIEYNNGWNAFKDFGVNCYVDNDKGAGERIIENFLMPIMPGKYRVSVLWNWGVTGTYTLNIRLFSVYGQTNLNSSSVYA